jgi:hypothetical protein
MALNLLQICDRALDEISSIAKPTYIVGNSDPVAVQLLACAKKVGEELVRDYDWQELSKTGTITTVEDTSTYALESDYDRIAPDTMWDATLYRQMRGHTARRDWAAITNTQVNATGITYYWRLKGNKIQIEPAAASVFSVSYEYLSNIYCTASDGTTDRADGWTADGDLPKLPHDLFINGVRYYFTKAKGLPYGDAEGEYDAVIQSRHGKNVPGESINLAAAVTPPGRGDPRRLNIPEVITDF